MLHEIILQDAIYFNVAF